MPVSATRTGPSVGAAADYLERHGWEALVTETFGDIAEEHVGRIFVG